MGTHPIFESDFDCLTENMVFKRISCAANNYAWGVPGSKSTVAQLAEEAVKDFKLDEGSPYAELWMSTHPKGPASFWDDKIALSEHIKATDGSDLGEKVLEKFGKKLPFLLKVLSVNKALSIQAHPNKSLAEILHAKDPAHYPDDNHKPEMCVALTDFTGLCGFRPGRETVGFLASVPELAILLGEKAGRMIAAKDDPVEYAKALKSGFSALMNLPKDLISAQVGKLVARIAAESPKDVEAELILRLNADFPGDVGIFVAYFLNYIKVAKGEAMFLRANLPHAYLSGDCVECMACSDNVVRAGLTPKFMDVETLIDMLEYSPNEADSFKFKAESDDGQVKVFNPDIPDFSLEATSLKDGKRDLPGRDSASILIVTSGKASINGILAPRGAVFYSSAKEAISIDASGPVDVYRAFV